MDINTVTPVAHVFIIYPYTWSKLTSPLVNCIISCTVLNATLSIHECYFNLLTLNDRLTALWHPTSCSRPEWGRGCLTVTFLVQCKRCCLVKKSYSIICPMSRKLLTLDLYIKRVCLFKEYFIEVRNWSNMQVSNK